MLRRLAHVTFVNIPNRGTQRNMKIFIPLLFISRHSLLSKRLELAKTERERRLANASVCKDSFALDLVWSDTSCVVKEFASA